VLLVLGDSLSAAYGMPLEQGWVTLLQRKLAATGHAYRVHNASVSGDTSATALARLPATLRLHTPSVSIIALGGNDGLRGLPVAELRANLESMIAQLRARGSRVLLVQIRMAPNYGKAYTRAFEAVYTDLAQGEEEVYLGRFLLDEVIFDDALMQPDGIHPRAEAQAIMLETVWPDLQPLL